MLGALGLIGVTKILGEDRGHGTASLVTTGVTMVSIAIGVLLGLALGSAISTTSARLGGGHARQRAAPRG